ncbi:hypothetical protein BESB_073890 [Besnoitia besnoiti]|uniref:Uncharacterized protein n=1 Tax=Besnoitia besnoiti TaxID=94643 RepID=A0A2A9MF23_BESBE|nr:uncharacterized protein BESB_073890 [Besnoitia besnoiti]PFH34237.1 hypothetical protein BESB_073890 [Besnoitia besnoiti]
MEHTSPIPIAGEGLQDSSGVWTPAAAPGIFALAPFPLFYSHVDATLCGCRDPLHCTSWRDPIGEQSAGETPPRSSRSGRGRGVLAEQKDRKTKEPARRLGFPSPLSSPRSTSPLTSPALHRATAKQHEPDLTGKTGDTPRGPTPRRKEPATNESVSSAGWPRDRQRPAHAEEIDIPRAPDGPGDDASAKTISFFCCTRWKHFGKAKPAASAPNDPKERTQAPADAGGDPDDEKRKNKSPTGNGVVCGMLLFDGHDFYEGRLLYRHLNPRLRWNAETWNRLFYALTHTLAVGSPANPTSGEAQAPLLSAAEPHLRPASSLSSPVSAARASSSSASPQRSSESAAAAPFAAPRDRSTGVRVVVHALDLPFARDEKPANLSVERRGDRAADTDGPSRGEHDREQQEPQPPEASARSASLRPQWTLSPSVASSLYRSPRRTLAANSSQTAPSASLFSLSSLPGLAAASGDAFKNKIDSAAPPLESPSSVSSPERKPAAEGRPLWSYVLSLVMRLGSGASELYVHLTTPLRMQPLNVAVGVRKLFTASILLQQLQLQEQARLFENAQKSSSALESCIAELATAAASRERQQQRLLRGMCLLLNEKKVKLCELRDELEASKRRQATAQRPVPSSELAQAPDTSRAEPDDGGEAISKKRRELQVESCRIDGEGAEQEGECAKALSPAVAQRKGTMQKAAGDTGRVHEEEVRQLHNDAAADSGARGADAREEAKDEDDEAFQWAAAGLGLGGRKKRKITDAEISEANRAQSEEELRKATSADDDRGEKPQEGRHGEAKSGDDGTSLQLTDGDARESHGGDQNSASAAPAPAPARPPSLSSSLSASSASSASSPSFCSSLPSRGMLKVTDERAFPAVFDVIRVKPEPLTASQEDARRLAALRKLQQKETGRASQAEATESRKIRPIEAVADEDFHYEASVHAAPSGLEKKAHRRVAHEPGDPESGLAPRDGSGAARPYAERTEDGRESEEDTQLGDEALEETQQLVHGAWASPLVALFAAGDPALSAENESAEEREEREKGEKKKGESARGLEPQSETETGAASQDWELETQRNEEEKRQPGRLQQGTRARGRGRHRGSGVSASATRGQEARQDEPATGNRGHARKGRRDKGQPPTAGADEAEDSAETHDGVPSRGHGAVSAEGRRGRGNDEREESQGGVFLLEGGDRGDGFSQASSASSLLRPPRKRKGLGFRNRRASAPQAAGEQQEAVGGGQVEREGKPGEDEALSTPRSDDAEAMSRRRLRRISRLSQASQGADELDAPHPNEAEGKKAWLTKRRTSTKGRG